MPYLFLNPCRRCVLPRQRVLLSMLLMPVVASSISSISSQEEVNVYIGAGCFWHVQEMLNRAEMALLGRSRDNLTGITGYLGGTDNSGEICYTNYGGKGHTEVVALRVPRNSLAGIASAAWRGLFKNGERSDDVNRGPEYRAAIGFPGGMTGASDLLEAFESSQPWSGSNRARLVQGHGDDEDSLGDRRVFVYDSLSFPFHQAELYHQFHDFSKNSRDALLRSGRLKELSCPSEFEAMLRQPVMIGILVFLGLCLLACGSFFCWRRFGQNINLIQKFSESQSCQVRDASSVHPTVAGQVDAVPGADATTEPDRKPGGGV